jgi:hypothetical protein
MAMLDEIKSMIEALRRDMEDMMNRRVLTAKQVRVQNGLSDISERLGLITAGEFRTGNSKNPGSGFSGVRIAYPAMNYLGRLWNIAGLNEDKLQFGLSSDDGTALAGGGYVVLDSNGLVSSEGGTFIQSGQPPSDGSDWKYLGFGTAYLNEGFDSSTETLDGIYLAEVTGETLISNGTFETGFLDGWTLGGAPSVSGLSPNGRYSATVSSANKINQLVSVVEDGYYMITFFAAGSGNIQLRIDFTSGGQNFVVPVEENKWKKIVIFSKMDGTTTADLKFYASTTENAFVDNISMFRISNVYFNTGTISTGDSFLKGVGEDLSDLNVVFGRVYFSTPNYLNFTHNGIPIHTYAGAYAPNVTVTNTVTKTSLAETQVVRAPDKDRFWSMDVWCRVSNTTGSNQNLTFTLNAKYSISSSDDILTSASVTIANGSTNLPVHIRFTAVVDPTDDTKLRAYCTSMTHSAMTSTGSASPNSLWWTSSAATLRTMVTLGTNSNNFSITSDIEDAGFSYAY